jgi:hypothetical protein
MVEVDLRTLVGGQPAQVFVVGIVLEKGNSFRADTLENGLGNRCLTGAGTTGNAYNEGRGRGHALIIPACLALS